MLRKLLTLAAAAGLAKKAWDSHKSKQTTAEEREALEAMAAEIKPAPKGGKRPSRKRREGPDAG